MNVNDFVLLLVEDDSDQIYFVQHALEKANLVNPLHVVRNGEQAIAYLSGEGEYADRKRFPLPSILLLDLRLPRVSGLDVLAWVREKGPRKEIPVVIMTSSSDPRDLKRAKELGVHSYLAKPVDAGGLVEMMKSVGVYWKILEKGPGASVPPEAPPGPAPAAEGTGAPVLVLDPDLDFQEALSRALRRRNPALAAQAASGSSQALEKLADPCHRALVCDRSALEDAFAFVDEALALRPDLAVFMTVPAPDPDFAARMTGRGVRQVLVKTSALGAFLAELQGALDEVLTEPIARAEAPSPQIGTRPTLRSTPGDSSRKSDSDTAILGERIHFQETSWDLIRSARNVEALDVLIRIYWKPLYFFVRQKGCSNEEAKDIVQEFLTRMIEKGTLLKADPSRGRFRTFLLSCLGNFMKDRHRGEEREKRGGGKPLLSLDFEAGEREFSVGAASGEAPEVAIDRVWARSLLDQAIAGLKASPSHLRAFEMSLKGKDHAAIAAETGLSPSAVRTATHRLRMQLRDVLVAYLSKTASTDEEIEAELSEFAALLR